jgi:hypothetical protein
MALQEGRIATRIAGGVETKLDPKSVPLTRLLDLRNGVFTRGGTVSKRSGFEALSTRIDATATSYSGTRALATRDDELILFCDSQTYSYRPSKDRWNQSGAAPAVTTTEAPVVRTGTTQTAADHATSNGITVIAWEDSLGGVWWSAIEEDTGRVLRVPAQLHASGQRPRCCPVGTVLHVYYCVPAEGTVYVLVVNPSDATASVSPTPLVLDLSTTVPSYDVEPTFGGYDTTEPAAIAWCEAGGGYRVGYVHSSGVLGSPVTSLPSVATWADFTGGPIAVAFDRVTNSGIAVMWVGGATAIDATTAATQAPRYRVHSSSTLTTSIVAGTLSATTGSGGWTRVTGAFGAASGGHGVLWWAGELDGATSEVASVIGGTIDSTTGAAVTSGTTLGHGIGARAMQVRGRVFQTLARSASLFSYYVVVEQAGGFAAPQTVAARILPGSAVGLPTRGHLPSAHPDANDASATVHHTILPYRNQLPGIAGAFAETSLERVALDFADTQGWQTAQLGRCLYRGGALLAQYDGRRWAEAGFHGAPEPSAPVIDNLGGSLTTADEYGWIFVYEEVNAQGEIDRGSISAAVEVTMTGGATQTTFAIPTCRLTGRRNVRIGVFRSLANDASVYYRVSSLDPSATTGSNRYVANDPTVNTVTFVDGMSDATAQLKERLYTTGGVLPNDPPPTGRALASGKNRLFYSDPADPDLVRYSQQLASGYAVECTDALAFSTPPYGGAVVALAVLDDAVIVLKETALYMVSGPGPNANPDADAAAGFSDPALITADVGCSSPGSVVTTPVGIMFQTAKGLYMLGRDRQVSYVGAPVESFNTQTVRSAVLLPDRTQVLFVCDSGRSLLYDYYFAQWSTFTIDGTAAALAGGVSHILRPDGRVFRETPGVYLDDHTQIELRIETAWYRFADALQGFQHVWHLHALGERRSAHQLVMQYAIDYQDNWSAPVTFDARTVDGTAYGDGGYGDGPYGGTPNSAYQWRWHLGQPCEAIRFRFYDSQDVGVAGQSFELTELLLTGGVKGPALRPFPSGRTG